MIQSSESNLIPTEEVANILGCSKGHLDNLRSREMGYGGCSRPIPYIRIGRNIRYDRDVVLQYKKQITTHYGDLEAANG